MPALALGTLVLYPDSREVGWLLPWILGGEPTNDVYQPCERLSQRVIGIDRVDRIDVFDCCLVRRATFDAGLGRALRLTLDVVGGIDTTELESFPDVEYSTGHPFRFNDCTFSLLGEICPLIDFALTIDNPLIVGPFCSNFPRFSPSDRTVTLSCQSPVGSYGALPSALPLAGASTSIAFLRGSDQLIFDLPNWQPPVNGPSTPARQTPLMQWNGVARAADSGPDLVVTLSQIR